eukprot:gene21579-5230_t
MGCGIGDHGARAIAAALPGCGLKELYIGENSITDAGVRAIADVIGQCPCLEKLYLGDNDIGDDGACALAAALAGSGLENLVLRNNWIGDDGARALA